MTNKQYRQAKNALIRKALEIIKNSKDLEEAKEKVKALLEK